MAASDTAAFNANFNSDLGASASANASAGFSSTSFGANTAVFTPAIPGGSPEAVSRLLEHPALWRAGQLQRVVATRPSGFPALDAHLPGEGWPRAGLAELLLGTTGIGELRMLAPLIRALCHDEARAVAWINPPFMPYAPALEALGIDLGRMLIISPRTHEEALWAAEQVSRSGTCSLMLAWFDERQLRSRDTRRLQFAAQQAQMLTCLFRPETAAAQQSMAELRLQLTPLEPGRLQVDIRKRRGGWPVSDIVLEVSESQPADGILQQLSAWRTLQQELRSRMTVQIPEACEPARPGSDWSVDDVALQPQADALVEQAWSPAPTVSTVETSAIRTTVRNVSPVTH